MNLLWSPGTSRRCLAVSSAVFGIFLTCALLSRALSSLSLVNDLRWAWILLVLLFIVVWVCVGVDGLLTKSTRKPSILFPSLLVALVLSRVALDWLSFPQGRALEMIIERYEPIVGAIERFEQDHGQPPATLDELVPGYLAAIPKAKLLGNELEPRYAVDSESGATSTWSIGAGEYVFLTFDGPRGEVHYRSDQQYENGEQDGKVTDWGRYHGWQWVIWD